MMTDWVFEQENAEKAAVIDGERKVTFAGLRQKIAAVCQSLRQLNKGRIALYLANDDDYLAAFFGVILAEMAVFPLNVLMTGYEISALLQQGEVSAVITSKAYRALFQDGAGAGRSVLYMEDIHMCGACGPPAAPVFDDDAPMVLLGTSGTTGNVKIVQLSKRNIETSLSGYLEKAAFEANDTGDSRFVISVPFSSAYGIMCLCACMIKGLGVVLLKGAFTPELFCKTIASHRVTHYEGGALILQLMEQLYARELPYDIGSLKYIGFGGSKASAETIEKVMEMYPQIEFTQGYGMSEAAPLISKHKRLKTIKPASVGTAIKGMEIAVETAEGITSSTYTEGEILVRGANVMLGYYNNEEETRKVLRNGYLCTGDIGYLDDERYLYICGRKKNCIVVRGFNVQPEEVEACIMAGKFAQDCMVYAKMDAFGNERLCAQVVPSSPDVTAEAIKAHCYGHLARYKCPQEIHFCAAIDKNAAGKTKRTRE